MRPTRRAEPAAGDPARLRGQRPWADVPHVGATARVRRDEAAAVRGEGRNHRVARRRRAAARRGPRRSGCPRVVRRWFAAGGERAVVTRDCRADDPACLAGERAGDRRERRRGVHPRYAERFPIAHSGRPDSAGERRRPREPQAADTTAAADVPGLHRTADETGVHLRDDEFAPIGARVARRASRRRPAAARRRRDARPGVSAARRRCCPRRPSDRSWRAGGRRRSRRASSGPSWVFAESPHRMHDATGVRVDEQRDQVGPRDDQPAGCRAGSERRSPPRDRPRSLPTSGARRARRGPPR